MTLSTKRHWACNTAFACHTDVITDDTTVFVIMTSSQKLRQCSAVIMMSSRKYHIRICCTPLPSLSLQHTAFARYTDVIAQVTTVFPCQNNVITDVTTMFTCHNDNITEDRQLKTQFPSFHPQHTTFVVTLTSSLRLQQCSHVIITSSLRFRQCLPVTMTSSWRYDSRH